jgi:uncharacterized protein YgbK (DUF1537 family)
LRNHPLNPMTDADLRRWLRLQTREPVGLVAHAAVRRGGDAIRAALRECADSGERLAIVDAVSEDDLLAIGDACADAPLMTGGSGIALGLPRNFIRKGLARGSSSGVRGIRGPEAILAGSCSVRTLEQVEAHRAVHPSLALDPEDILSGAVTPRHVVDFVTANVGRAPLVFSSAAPDAVARAQARFGRDAVAQAVEAFFAQAARDLVESGVQRLVVAGGETSGAVVSALGLTQLAIGPEIDPGVPMLLANEGRRPLALALKSGNFGGRDFFARALEVLAQ